MWAALLEMVPLYFVKRWRSPNQDAWQVDRVEIPSADQETASHTRLWSSGNNTKKKQAQKGYDIFTNSKYSICCYITIHSKNKKQNQTKPNTRNNFKGRAFMNWSFCCRTQIFTTGSDQLLLAYKQSQPSHESFDLCQIFFSCSVHSTRGRNSCRAASCLRTLQSQKGQTTGKRKSNRLKVNSCRNSKHGRKNEALHFFMQLVESSKFKTLFLCKTHLFSTSFYFVTLNEIHGRRRMRAKRTKKFCLKTFFVIYYICTYC